MIHVWTFFIVVVTNTMHIKTFLTNNDDKHDTYLDFVDTLHQSMDLMTRSTCDYCFNVIM